MASPGPDGATVRPRRLESLDSATAALVRMSARIAGGDEDAVRAGLAECRDAGVPELWVEELILQSYLFAGFPRALNAAREWRRSYGDPSEEGERRVRSDLARSEERGAEGTGERAGEGAGEGTAAVTGKRTGEGTGAGKGAGDRASEENYASVYDWRVRGQETCATVYGVMYEKLRGNIRRLHPELDEWMVVEGYGKVLSREGLDLPRRELCIVAACVAAQQDRQLHSHLHGALNAGTSAAAVTAALAALVAPTRVVPGGAAKRASLLWNRVRGK